jgi:hypothetical protein
MQVKCGMGAYLGLCNQPRPPCITNTAVEWSTELHRTWKVASSNLGQEEGNEVHCHLPQFLSAFRRKREQNLL